MPRPGDDSDGKALHERTGLLFPERRRGDGERGDNFTASPTLPVTLSGLRAARNYLIERVLEEHTLQVIAEVSSAHRLCSRLCLTDIAPLVKDC